MADNNDGPLAAARRRQQEKEALDQAAAIHAPLPAGSPPPPRQKSRKPRSQLPKPLRFVASILLILQLLVAWVTLWIIQVVAMTLTYPFTTVEQRQDICGHIHRKVNYFFVVLLNPLWWTTIVRPFPTEKLAKTKNGSKLIVMMNHLSNSDPWIAIRPMGWGIDCKWICKGSLFKVPFGGWGLKNAGDLAIKFTADKEGWGTEKGSVGQLMADARALLKRGQPIAVFPEGVRSFDAQGGLNEFKLGFFTLAVEEGAVIVPMAFSGCETAWPRGDWMFDFARCYASCGDPISAEGHTPESLRDKVWAAITELREAHPDRIALKKKLAAAADKK